MHTLPSLWNCQECNQRGLGQHLQREIRYISMYMMTHQEKLVPPVSVEIVEWKEDLVPGVLVLDHSELEIIYS